MKQPVSIVTDLNERECFICGRGGDLALHHMLHGSNRQKADEDHLVCWLCPECHTALHDKGHKDKDLMQVAQMAWQKTNKKGIGEFISRYGKNYL